MMSTPPPLPSDLEEHTLDINGLDLHLVAAGPEEGPPVLLLHGFPEFWFGWRNQIGPLAAAGYRVLAPDQRGYNLSAKPPGMLPYTRRQLALDMIALLDQLGHERAAVVGHDWGGAVAWWMALQHPERVERLGALNLPHPVVFARALKGGRQALRSWYMLLFQLPWLPEAILGRRDFQPLLDLLRHSSNDGAYSDQDLERYREAFARPGALSAMLAWYRAAVRGSSEELANRQAAMPVSLIWGAKDTALGVEMAEPSMVFCDQGELHIIPEAGHFVQNDAYTEVNALLLTFLHKG